MKKLFYGLLTFILSSFIACTSSDDEIFTAPDDVVGWWELYQDHYDYITIDAKSHDTLEIVQSPEIFYFKLNKDGTAYIFDDKDVGHYRITKDSFIFEGIKSAIELRTPTYMRVNQTLSERYDTHFKTNIKYIRRSIFVKIEKD